MEYAGEEEKHCYIFVIGKFSPLSEPASGNIPSADDLTLMAS
jgi:hypothetical protein